MTVRRRMARRFERAFLGTVMNVIAFIIERRIRKVIRGTGGERPKPPREGEFYPASDGPAGHA